MDKTQKNVSVIIMAAGNSSRMGFPKLFLQFDKARTFVEQILNEYQLLGCSEFVVVVNEKTAKFMEENAIALSSKVKIVINKHPEWHRFYSLKLGAGKLTNKHFCFVHNVDNPFVSQLVLNKLWLNKNKGDYTKPVYKSKGGHPILLAPQIISDLCSTTENQVHLKTFLAQYPKNEIPVNDATILVNINTREDYERYFKII